MTGQTDDYNHPIAKRHTDQYQEEYVHNFVRKWDELIDWEARAETEGDFFIRLLKERGVKRILDVATGTGFHSVRLLKAGFDVVSLDGSPEMLAQAFENARRHGFILRTVQADWRWLGQVIDNRYDAVICLGNSFTHLFSEQDRRKVLAEFYAALEYGGALILDQRNYDGILDHGFTSKHIYYYCGDNISAEPVYIDEGLARFQYRFPDNSEFHLNMFPLRKEYMRRLMLEVGFQHIYTYADFQETHKVEDPDFFIHVAEKKSHVAPRPRTHRTYSQYSKTVETAREYYNSSDADHFYAAVWGGEDIHIGIYKHEDESIHDASRRTVQKIVAQLPEMDAKTRVLDIGSGYGGAARRLASTYGCHVTCLNLSESQNRRNDALNRAQGLHLLINVVDGSFEDIALPDGLLDVVWSQDALLHSGNRAHVFAEVSRVLDKDGHFIFTDIMQSDTCSPDMMQPILDRINLESLGSLALYRHYAAQAGLEEVEWIDLSPHLNTHYTRVLQEVQDNYEELRRVCSEDYLNRAQIGLRHWIDGGKGGDLVWGILHFRKV